MSNTVTQFRHFGSDYARERPDKRESTREKANENERARETNRIFERPGIREEAVETT